MKDLEEKNMRKRNSECNNCNKSSNCGIKYDAEHDEMVITFCMNKEISK